MNIIEKRRRKAWAHATMVIMNKVIREASTGTIFIYGETLYGKDYFLTPDDVDQDERAGLDARIRGGVGLYCPRTRMRI